MSDRPDESTAPAKKTRGHYIAPEMPYPHLSPPEPLWKRTSVRLFALIALVLSLPGMFVLWNIVRPDAPTPPKAAWPDYASDPRPPEGRVLNGKTDDLIGIDANLVASVKVFGKVLLTLPPELIGDARIVSGKSYDASITPRLIEAFDKRLAEIRHSPVEKPVVDRHPPLRPADITAFDGFLRAKAAHARATNNAAGLAGTYRDRIEIAASLIRCSSTPGDFSEALAHARSILGECRGDAALIITDTNALKEVIRDCSALNAESPPYAARAIAQAFDAALDERPDDALALMRAPAPADASGFVRLAFAARKPGEHRAQVSGLHRQFADALAKPTFREARAALYEPGPAKSIRLAKLLLRADALKRLGDDIAERYFFSELTPPDGDLEVLALKFATLSGVDDPYGEAVLLHRRARLLRLVAERDRTRFEAAATVFSLALEYRRTANDGKWPGSTDALLDGLAEIYPQDPFAEDIPFYSKKSLTLHSPGADGVERGGLPEPEFATELAQLWEPTVPLVAEPDTDPKAFGLKASDFDKPVERREWKEIP